jgi:hypothetical protein
MILEYKRLQGCSFFFILLLPHKIFCYISPMMRLKKYYYLLFAICYLPFVSCSQPDFKKLESSKQSGITLETRYWQGFFEHGGDFELKFTNNSSKDYTKCIIILDGKYKHTLNGLYSVEKGLIKTDVFKVGEQYTLKFSTDYSNTVYFDIRDDKFVYPKTISIQSDSLFDEWKF